MTFSFIRCFWLLFYSWVFSYGLQAQNGLSRSSARLLGTLSVAHSDSGSRFAVLPVWFPSLVDRGSLQLGVVNRHGLGSLTETFLRLQRPVGSGTFKASMGSVGDARYRQSAFQIGLNKQLTDGWCVGLDLGFSQTRVAGYGNRWSPQISVSVSGALEARTQVGMQWENPQAWMGNKPLMSYASPRIRFGLIRNISDRLNLLGWMDWERASVPGIFLQGHYGPVAKWSFDVGWGRSPDQISLGLERMWLKGVVRTSFSQDPVLGASFLFGYRYLWLVKKSSR